MEQENSKVDSEQASIKGSKTSTGSQVKKVFHERENDQLWQMKLRAQEIFFPQVNQGLTLDLVMWKGLKKAHFSGVLMTKTRLVESMISWKERSEGCIGNIFQDFGCKMKWWNCEGMLKQGRFFMIGAIYYSMFVSWWKWQQNRCYRRKERQLQRHCSWGGEKGIG